MDNGSARLKSLMFKPVAGGWVYRAPNPWVFGHAPHYLVNDAQKDHNSILRSVFVCAALAVALSLPWSNIPTSAASAAENKINAEVLKNIQDLANQLRGLRLGYKVTADNMAQFCIDVEKADKIATQLEALIEPLKQEHNEKLSPGLIKIETGAKGIHEVHSKAVQECAKNNHPME